MGLGNFDETQYDDAGGLDSEPVGLGVERDDRGGGAPERERSRPCPGPPHHHAGCCLAPQPRSVLRRAAEMIRGRHQGGSRGDRT